MTYVTCPHCGVKLEVDECDTMPGCREMEEVICPECKKIADKVFTSGIPVAYVINNKNDE